MRDIRRRQFITLLGAGTWCEETRVDPLASRANL
jgi:hypothetical protein